MATVLVSMLLSVVTALTCASSLLVFTLPESIASQLNSAYFGLLAQLPDAVFDITMCVCLIIALASSCVGCAVSIIAGLRAWRIGGPSMPAISLTAWGALLALVLGAGPLAFHTSLSTRMQRNTMRSKVVAEEFRQRLEAGAFASSHREQAWRLYAQMMYWDQGVLVEIPDERGTNVLYKPTEAEVTSRQTYLDLWNRFKPPYKWTASILVFVSICAGLGILAPIRREPPVWGGGATPANNRMQVAAGGMGDDGPARRAFARRT